MELKFKKDILSVVTNADIKKRSEIIEQVNERGYIQKGEAEFLLSFDLKARVCNTCGKTYKEVNGWIFATAQDKQGKEINIGLFENCFECTMKNVMSKNTYANNNQ